MNRKLRNVYWISGAACIAYYFVFSMASRFGLSLSFIWLFGGAMLIAAGFSCMTDRIPRLLRRIWRTGLCLGLVLLISLTSLVAGGMNSTPPDGLDYVIVLGARVDPDGPSPALRRRLNATLKYLENNPDTIIIASGGQGWDEPMSEAECIRRELEEAGIDSARILKEDQSTTTMENLLFSKALMTSPDASAGLITNNYHVYRAVLLAQTAGLSNVYGIAAEYTGFTLPHYMVREAVCLVVELLRGNL